MFTIPKRVVYGIVLPTLTCFGLLSVAQPSCYEVNTLSTARSTEESTVNHDQHHPHHPHQSCIYIYLIYTYISYDLLCSCGFPMAARFPRFPRGLAPGHKGSRQQATPDRRGLGQGMVWRWCPSSLAKLVPRTPISLWFMADITIVNGCQWGLNTNKHH